jgi:ABC-type cobalamin/Fe3+-siderophores transport system ATPase subunit
MLKVDGLAKHYAAVRAVDDIGLEIPDGQMVGIIGRSGAGKSTLLRLINRLVEPTAGRIYCDGRDVTALKGTELRRAEIPDPARRGMQVGATLLERPAARRRSPSSHFGPRTSTSAADAAFSPARSSASARWAAPTAWRRSPPPRSRCPRERRFGSTTSAR